MAQIIPAYTPRIEAQEFARKNAWGTSLKNVFFGSLENWRDHTLTIGAVYYVAQSVFLLISGYWLYAAIGLGTAVLMARMRKDLREFANIRKETADYQKRNNDHRNINMKQQEITNDLHKIKEGLENDLQLFTAQIESMKTEGDRYKTENNKHAFNNKVNAKLITKLGKTAKELKSDVKKTLKEGNNIQKETLSRFYEALTQFDEQRETMDEVATQIKQGNVEILDRMEGLHDNLENMSYRGVRALRKAEKDLAKKQQAIKDATKQLVKIKAELEETTRLNKEATKLSKKAAQESYEAAQKSNAAAGIFKMVANTFFSSSELDPVTGDPKTDWGKVIVYAGVLAAVSRWAIKV